LRAASLPWLNSLPFSKLHDYYARFGFKLDDPSDLTNDQMTRMPDNQIEPVDIWQQLLADMPSDEVLEELYAKHVW
jgi:hypothetical protein